MKHMKRYDRTDIFNEGFEHGFERGLKAIPFTSTEFKALDAAIEDGYSFGLESRELQPNAPPIDEVWDAWMDEELDQGELKQWWSKDEEHAKDGTLVTYHIMKVVVHLLKQAMELVVIAHHDMGGGSPQVIASNLLIDKIHEILSMIELDKEWP